MRIRKMCRQNWEKGSKLSPVCVCRDHIFANMWSRLPWETRSEVCELMSSRDARLFSGIFRVVCSRKLFFFFFASCIIGCCESRAICLARVNTARRQIFFFVRRILYTRHSFLARVYPTRASRIEFSNSRTRCVISRWVPPGDRNLRSYVWTGSTCREFLEQIEHL